MPHKKILKHIKVLQALSQWERMVAEPSQIGLVPDTGLQVAPAGGMGQIHVRLLLRGLAEQASTRKQLLHSSPVGDNFQISTVRYCAWCRGDTDTSCSPWAIYQEAKNSSEHGAETRGFWAPPGRSLISDIVLTNEAFRVQWGVMLSPWSTYLLVQSSPKNNFCKVINTFFMIFQVTAFNLMGDCMYVLGYTAPEGWGGKMRSTGSSWWMKCGLMWGRAVQWGWGVSIGLRGRGQPPRLFEPETEYTYVRSLVFCFCFKDSIFK